MLKAIGLTLISALLVSSSCIDNHENIQPTCEVEATIRDFGNLQYCGMMVELTDGTRLIPTSTVCFGNGAFHGIDVVDGKKLKIAYKILPDAAAPVCDAIVAEIIRLTEVDSPVAF